MSELSDNTQHDSGSSIGASTEQFPPGHILATKYRVKYVLGKGGMGTVYCVEQIYLKKDLALKVLDSRGALNDVQVRRFQTEGRMAFSLTHPSLVKVHDFGVFEDGQPYLVMEYVPGTTLAELLKKQGSLSLDQIEKIFPQACFGIAHAHRQSIIHRDIKPSNIMLVEGIALGEEGSVKIVDFGIAKLTSEEGGEIQSLTQTGEIFGSPLYMSPEQCSGEQIDARTDVYSLGCVLFEAITGTPPHVGNNALRTMMLHQSESAPSLREAALGKDFPHELEAIVQKMLQKSPGDRFDNLGIVAHEISEACKKNIQSAYSVSKPRQEEQKSASKPDGKKQNGLSQVVNPSFVAGLLVAGVIASSACVVMLVVSSPEKINKSDSTLRKPLQRSDGASTGENDLSSAVNGFDPAERSKNITIFENGDVAPLEMENQIKILKASGPIKSKLVKVGGKQKKRFVFPACGMGRITNRIRSEETFEKVPYGAIEAAGQQLVPADSPLTLEENCHTARAVFAYPSILEQIDPKEFNEILLSTRLPLTMPSTLSEELIGLSFLKMLKICSSWTNLQSVALFDMPQSKESLEILNDFPAIKSFHISSPKESENKGSADAHKELGSAEWAGTIRRQPFIKRLKHLGLEELTVNALLPTLASLPNLESLAIIDTNATPAAILSLRNCPRIKQIRFCEHAGPTDDQLKALSQLKQLRILYIKETTLSPAQLKILTGCDKKTRLLISSRSQTAINALQPKDPRVELVMER